MKKEEIISLSIKLKMLKEHGDKIDEFVNFITTYITYDVNNNNFIKDTSNFVINEIVENIIKISFNDESRLIFKISYKGDKILTQFKITHINNNRARTFLNLLNYVNSLSQEKLKGLYNEYILTVDTFTGMIILKKDFDIHLSYKINETELYLSTLIGE